MVTTSAQAAYRTYELHDDGGRSAVAENPDATAKGAGDLIRWQYRSKHYETDMAGQLLGSNSFTISALANKNPIGIMRFFAGPDSHERL